jgi:hypothetical protein
MPNDSTAAPLSPGSATLLAEAPVGRHIGQVHRGRQTLVQSVYEFTAPGLRRGEAVVIIASAFHSAIYLGRLRDGGLDPRALHESGQLVVRDAQELLGAFVRHGIPRWEDFLAIVGGVIGSVQAGDWKGIRVYGEMVSDLWRAHNIAASMRLEMYWNDLSRLYPFSLLCGYELGDMDDQSYARALGQIGKSHTDLIPAVSSGGGEPPASRAGPRPGGRLRSC